MYESTSDIALLRAWQRYGDAEATASLPDGLRIPLVEHFLQQKGHQEVADSTGVPRFVPERLRIDRIPVWGKWFIDEHSVNRLRQRKDVK